MEPVYPDEIYYTTDRYDLFCVHFSNRRLKLSKTQIEIIFSMFGEVQRVNESGDEGGYRFVAFREESEVLNCIHSLKDHPTIRLLPKKDKLANYIKANQKPKEDRHNGDNQRENLERERNTCDQSNTSNQKESLINAAKQESQKEFDNCSQKGSLMNDDKKGSEISYRLTKREISIGQDNPEKKNAQNELIENSYEDGRQSINEWMNKNNNLIKEFQKTKASKSATEEASSDISVPNLQSHEALSLSMSSIHLSEEPYSNVQMAEEVIVGNIPEYINSEFFLVLFFKQRPLAVSEIFYCDDFLRCCHVYFPTFEDALDAEKQFDNEILDGQKIIVVSRRSLESKFLN